MIGKYQVKLYILGKLDITPLRQLSKALVFSLNFRDLALVLCKHGNGRLVKNEVKLIERFTAAESDEKSALEKSAKGAPGGHITCSSALVP